MSDAPPSPAPPPASPPAAQPVPPQAPIGARDAAEAEAAAEAAAPAAPEAAAGPWAAGLRQALRRFQRAMRGRVAPDVREALEAEAQLAAWSDRIVVLLYAALTGLLVVGFTLLSEAASEAFLHGRTAHRWGPGLALLWTPLVTVAVLAWMRQHAPAAAGAGIPHVVRALDEQTTPRQAKWLASLRLSVHKIFLVSGSLLAGLSLGREGPTVQVGAGVMAHARRWLSPRSAIDPHDLMVAGAAAGIAAAFNTPLGGIVFALEQLARRKMAHSSLTIASIVLAGLISISVFGNVTYFGRVSVAGFSWSLLGPGLLVALSCGIGGGLFVRLVVQSLSPGSSRWQRWRAEHPYRFAAGCAFGVALIGWATHGATAGAGHLPTRAMLEGGESPAPLFTLLKFCATWLSVWAGVPGGAFAPSLAIGASVGHDIAGWVGLHGPAAVPLIALGMVGFLAASTQNPITAFIIVMEMVSGQSMVLSLMACALTASTVARLLSPPMYDTLAALIRVPQDPPRTLGAR